MALNLSITSPVTPFSDCFVQFLALEQLKDKTFNRKLFFLVFKTSVLKLFFFF